MFLTQLDDYDNEYDSEILSEIYQDGDSINVLNPAASNDAPFRQQQQQNQLIYDDINHKKTVVDMANLNYSNLAYGKTRIPNNQDSGLDRTASTKRIENYQRLSNSINDLFTNLLSQLETKKQKSYLNSSKYAAEYHNLDTTVTEEALDNSHEKTLSYTDLTQLANPNQHSPQQQHPTSFVNKKQNLSKDSNKDSGFNQEFLTDSLYRNKYYANKQQPQSGSLSPPVAEQQAYSEYQERW